MLGFQQGDTGGWGTGVVLEVVGDSGPESPTAVLGTIQRPVENSGTSPLGTPSHSGAQGGGHRVTRVSQEQAGGHPPPQLLSWPKGQRLLRVQAGGGESSVSSAQTPCSAGGLSPSVVGQRVTS